MNQEATALQAKEKSMADWIGSQEVSNAIRTALPSHVTPERFLRVALTAANKNPKIAECTKSSLYQVLLDCSSLGLEPDGRRAHIIPYGKQAQLIVDYKGLIELAKRSGEVVKWRPELVCENDVFDYEKGMVTRHSIDWKEPRGKPYAVYSYVKTKDGEEDYEVMTFSDVEAVRQRSKAKNDGPWVTDFNEMAKKTVMRRHSKRLTLSPEFHDALQKDFDSFEDIEVQASPSIDELMPKRLSEVQNINSKAAPMIDVPQADPDAIADRDGLKEILEASKNSKVPNDVFKAYLVENYSIDSVLKIKQRDVSAICKWLNDYSPAEKAKPKQKASNTDRPDWMNEPITEAQSKRFYAICQSKGVTNDQMKDYLYSEWNIEHSRDIMKGDYEEICKWAESQ